MPKPNPVTSGPAGASYTAPSGPAPDAGPTASAVVVQKSDNGGFVVLIPPTGGGGPPGPGGPGAGPGGPGGHGGPSGPSAQPEQHVFPNFDAMVVFLKACLGGEAPAAGPQDDTETESATQPPPAPLG